MASVTSACQRTPLNASRAMHALHQMQASFQFIRQFGSLQAKLSCRYCVSVRVNTFLTWKLLQLQHTTHRIENLATTQPLEETEQASGTRMCLESTGCAQKRQREGFPNRRLEISIVLAESCVSRML